MSAVAKPAPAEAFVLRHDADGVATLTLNRPAQRNVLSTGMMSALQGELDALAQDRDIKVVVIAGAGPGFCAGHDLKEMRATPKREAYVALFEQCSRLMLSITRLPQPVIARVHAIAAAAGCQLVATCDLAVAGESAKFAVNGVNIGLFCSTPMVALSRAIAAQTSDGDAADRRHDRCPDRPRPRPGQQGRAGCRTRRGRDRAGREDHGEDPVAVKIGKEAFYKQAELSLDDAYKYTSGVMVQNMAAKDAEAGIDAFIAKQPMPKWQGR